MKNTTYPTGFLPSPKKASEFRLRSVDEVDHRPFMGVPVYCQEGPERDLHAEPAVHYLVPEKRDDAPRLDDVAHLLVLQRLSVGALERMREARSERGGGADADAACPPLTETRVCGHVRTRMGNWCASTDSLTNSTPILMQPCADEWRQRWKVEPALDGGGESFMIRSLDSSNKCMDVEGARAADKTRVILWDCDARAANQRFYRQYVADDKTKKCVDVLGGRAQDGAPLIIYTCDGAANGADNQAFLDHRA